ncbi:hypothetical protein IGI04_001880 [Brassica rapa subsp. trilocularis]|nr:hypothetical protein IGI04_001880 [Brassica rapa subsp. trilocularis]
MKSGICKNKNQKLNQKPPTINLDLASPLHREGETLYSDVIMPFNTVMEVEPPSLIRYLIGSAVMMIGVVLPVGYMMFRNKRVPSSSSYSKQT